MSFRDLKAAKIKAKKYPFIPVFSKATGVRDEDDEDTDDDFAGGFEDDESKVGSETDMIGRDSHSGLSLKELDDWTDSSSLLPSFVQDNRRRVVQRSKTMLSPQKRSDRGWRTHWKFEYPRSPAGGSSYNEAAEYRGESCPKRQ